MPENDSLFYFFREKSRLANTGFIDITRDGQRILLSQPQPNANTALTLVLNWAAVLKQ